MKQSSDHTSEKENPRTHAMEISREVKQFVLAHRLSSPTELALRATRYPNIDMPFALDQIAGWQTARKKLPSWAEKEDIVYPPHLAMEQCSSEQTARYKARLVRRLASEYDEEKAEQTVGDHEPVFLTDLTGGLGVDFSFMAQGRKATYVERQSQLCTIAAHNFAVLGLEKTKVVKGDGAEFLHEMDFSTITYLDPARRDDHGGKTVAINDCTPNLLELKDELIRKSGYAIVKLSPMLDWHQAHAQLNATADIVREIHILSVRNECKELLFVLREGTNPLKIFCINDNENFTMETTVAVAHREIIRERKPETGDFLYEPNASIMKAGGFGELTVRYGGEAISRNSHLFVSDVEINDFPGRGFVIKRVSTFNKKKLRSALNGISAANIATRNFPISATELRKKLKLKDGGNNYVFATTDNDGRHLLLICEKSK